MAQNMDMIFYFVGRGAAFVSYFVIFICCFYMAFRMRTDLDDCAVEFASRLMCGFWSLMAILGMFRVVDGVFLDLPELVVTVGFAVLMVVNVFFKKGLSELINVKTKNKDV